MFLLRCWSFTLREQEKNLKSTPYCHHTIVGGRGGGKKGCYPGGGITGWHSRPLSCTLILPLYISPTPLLWIYSKILQAGKIQSLFFSSNNCTCAFFYCLAKPQYEEGIWNERQLQCHVLVPFLTSFNFKFEWLSRTNKFFLTSSIVSGSDADASHLLFRMKMFGLERRWFTLWKKFFSCK